MKRIGFSLLLAFVVFCGCAVDEPGYRSLDESIARPVSKYISDLSVALGDEPFGAGQSVVGGDYYDRHSHWNIDGKKINGGFRIYHNDGNIYVRLAAHRHVVVVDSMVGGAIPLSQEFVDELRRKIVDTLPFAMAGAEISKVLRREFGNIFVLKQPIRDEVQIHWADRHCFTVYLDRSANIRFIRFHREKSNEVTHLNRNESSVWYVVALIKRHLKFD